MTDTVEFILRIALACLCGAMVGIERTVRLKEAGIRTHTIVALGAALMMVVSKYGFTDAALYGGGFDASRIASTIVTGISFLGAGVIFIRGNSIHGLTTSAGIWATAGIGMALGAGMYEVGLAATGILLVLQLLLHWVVGGLDSMTLSDLSVTVRYSPRAIGRVKGLLAEHGMTVQRCRAGKSQDNAIVLHLTVKSAEAIPLEALVELFQQDEEILDYSI